MSADRHAREYDPFEQAQESAASRKPFRPCVRFRARPSKAKRRPISGKISSDESRQRSGDADVEQDSFRQIAERMRMNAPKVPISVGRREEERQRRVHVDSSARPGNGPSRAPSESSAASAKMAGLQQVRRIVPQSRRSRKSSKSNGRPAAKLCASPAPTTVVVSSVSSNSSACSQ